MRHERVKEREIEKELERESKKGRSRKMEGGRWKTQTGKKKNWEERTREFESLRVREGDRKEKSGRK